MVFKHSDPETTSASGRPKAERRKVFKRILALVFAEHLLLGNTRREFRHLISSESLSISPASPEKFMVHVLSLPIPPWSEILTKAPGNTKSLCFSKQVFSDQMFCSTCADSLWHRKQKAHVTSVTPVVTVAGASSQIQGGKLEPNNNQQAIKTRNSCILDFVTSRDKLKAKGKRLAAPAKIESSATCLDGETQEYDPATFSSFCYCLQVVEA